MLTQVPVLHIPVQSGVVFDNSSTSGYEAALSTYSWTHRVGSGTNRVLIVGVSIFASGSVTGITYNGVALSKIRHDVTGIYRSEVWQLVAPATGSNTVAVTLSTSLTSIANAQSYTGVDQTTPIDANNGGTGTNTPASASVTTVTNKDRVVGNLAAQSASGISSAAGDSPRTLNAGALGTSGSDDKGSIDTAGSTTLSWNGLGTLDSWAVSLAGLKPAPLSVSYSQTPSDTIVFSDSLSKTVVKSSADTITWSDSSSRVTTWIRTPSDTITFSDSLAKTLTKSVSDTVSFSDAQGRTETVVKADSIVWSDQVVKTLTHSVSDSITWADSLSRTGSTRPSDTVTWTDSFAKSVTKSLADSITWTDTQRAVETVNRADSITWADSIVKAISKAKADTISWSDNPSVLVTVPFGDVLSFTDSYSIHLTLHPVDVIIWTDVARQAAPQTLLRVRLRGREPYAVFMANPSDLRAKEPVSVLSGSENGT